MGNIVSSAFTVIDYGDKVSQHPGFDVERDTQWIIQMARYYMEKAGYVMNQRYATNEASKQMYSSVFDKSKKPLYTLTDDGSPKSVEFEYINKVAKPINTQTGERATQDYEIKATVTNSDAKSRIENKKRDMYIDKYMAPIMQQIEKSTGVKMPTNIGLLGESNIEKYFTDGKGYRDMYADAAEKVLNEWMEATSFKSQEIQAYRNFRITGDVVFNPYIHPTTFDVVNPLIDTSSIVFDVDMKDDFGRGMQYFVYFDYRAISSVMNEFPNIDRDEIMALAAYDTENSTNYSGSNYSYYYTGSNDEIYVMVARVKFLAPMDMLKRTNKKTGNIDLVKYGTKQYETLSTLYEEGYRSIKDRPSQIAFANEGYNYTDQQEGTFNLKKLGYEELFHCDLIAGQIMGRGGILKNQYRSIDDLMKGNMGVFLFVPNFINKNSTSDLIRVKELQEKLNMLWFKASEFIADAKGTILDVDMAQLPLNPATQLPDFNYFMSTLQSNKIKLRDSSRIGKNYEDTGYAANSSVLTTQDLGVSPSVTVIFQAIGIVEDQIEDIIGISKSRTGDIDKYESVRNARLNKTQSDYVTAYPNIGFDLTVEQTLTHIANLLKISARLKKQSGMKIGDQAKRLIEDEDALFSDIGIRVKKRRNVSEMREFIDFIITLSVQGGGAIGVLEALILKDTDNISEAIDKLRTIISEEKIKEIIDKYKAEQQASANKMEEIRAKSEGAQAVQTQNLAGSIVRDREKFTADINKAGAASVMNVVSSALAENERT